MIYNFNRIYIILYLLSPILLLNIQNVQAEQNFDLGEIVVTAQKNAVSKVTTTNEITSEDIKARGCETIADALKLIPGVYVEKGGKGELHVYIRGFPQDDIKVLIDGVPAYETYFHTLDLSEFPIDAISKIKIIKGASSVLYGANTMGGVINIITKKGSKKPSVSMKAAFGDYGTQHYAFSHGWQKHNINYFFTYAYQKSDGFRLSDDFNPNNPYLGINSPYREDGGKRDLSDYEKNAFNAKIGYDTNKTQLYLSFDYHNNERGIPTEYNRYWRFTKWDQWLLNIVAQQKLNDSITLKARGFYVDHKDELSSYTDRECDLLGGKWYDKSAYNDYTAGGEIELRIQTHTTNMLTIGGNYLFEQHKQRDYNPRKKGTILAYGWQDWELFQTATYTLAIEDELSIGNFIITPGFSYNKLHPIKSSQAKTRDDIDTFDPQIGIFYKINPNTTIHTSLGRKTRFPHMKELYSDHGGGNPNLKAQHTTAFELGGEKYFNYKALSGSFRVSYFYNKIRDLIDRVDLPSGEAQYQNIGRARIQGIESTLEIVPTSSLLTSISYTYIWAKDDDKSRRLERIPQDKIDTDIRYKFDFGLNINIQSTYVHRQFQYLYDKNTKKESMRRIPDYFLINLKIDQKLMKHIKLFAQVTNLFDVNYDQGSGPMPGRNFLVGIEARW